MLSEVTTLHVRGRRVPKWQSHRPGIVGRLNIRPEFDKDTGRHRITAWLSDPGGADLLDPPHLLDAVVLNFDSEGATITGVERLPDESIGVTPIEYGQEWRITFRD